MEIQLCTTNHFLHFDISLEYILSGQSYLSLDVKPGEYILHTRMTVLVLPCDSSQAEAQNITVPQVKRNGCNSFRQLTLLHCSISATVRVQEQLAKGIIVNEYLVLHSSEQPNKLARFSSPLLHSSPINLAMNVAATSVREENLAYGE